jgi:methyltransferase (TIGR00027 family)
MSPVLPVDSVSDTALLLACLRALESERPDAHFHDPLARRLAGPRGTEFADRLPGGSASSAGCVVRTCLIDELLLQILSDQRIDVVLNLGAGLDTRPYRLDLKPSLRWIEVDLADVLSYKNAILTDCRPHCRLESAELDITDLAARRRLLAELSAGGDSILVVTEGLLIYLSEDEVASLAADLHAQEGIGWWLTDLASAEALPLVERMLKGSANSGQVRLRFAPSEGMEFFRARGWAPREFHSCVDAGRRLQRWILPESDFVSLAPAHRAMVRQLTGVVNLERE